MTLTETLDRLDELDRMATHGPWYMLPGRPSPSRDDHGHRIVADERVYVDRDSAHKSGMGRYTREADLITELRNSYPELSRQVRALIAENERMRGALEQWTCSLCDGRGRKTWHRRDICECKGCAGTGKHQIARKALEDGK